MPKTSHQDPPIESQQEVTSLIELPLGSQHYLIFELGYTGHYPHYIRHLTQFWADQTYPGTLTVVVSPQFAQHHSEVLEVAQSSQPHRIRFEVLSVTEAANLVPRQSAWHRARRSRQEWSLLRQYAKQLKATHCLLLYFDSFQAAALLRAPLPCPVSGIYFRPTLHYRNFGCYQPTRKERLQEWREHIVLPQVLKHPQLRHLFCLDPFFVDFAQKQLKLTSPIYLPDPVETVHIQSEQQVVQFKQKLGIESRRTTFLLFGALYDRRKGIKQVLEAIAQLPATACEKICLLLVGQLGDEQGNALRAQIDQLTKTHPVQIVIHEGFIPDEEVTLCFQSVEVVLAPYQRHVGMSGILVHAAAARKPLIASNYGLLGETVRQFQLGLSIDSTVPAEIAKAIQQCLESPLHEIGDRQQMSKFARKNSAKQFAGVIFKTLHNNPKGGPL